MDGHPGRDHHCCLSGRAVVVALAIKISSALIFRFRFIFRERNRVRGRTRLLGTLGFPSGVPAVTAISIEDLLDVVAILSEESDCICGIAASDQQELRVTVTVHLTRQAGLCTNHRNSRPPPRPPPNHSP
jgi:hypothetical protein